MCSALRHFSLPKMALHLQRLRTTGLDSAATGINRFPHAIRRSVGNVVTQEFECEEHKAIDASLRLNSGHSTKLQLWSTCFAPYAIILLITSPAKPATHYIYTESTDEEFGFKLKKSMLLSFANKKYCKHLANLLASQINAGQHG